MRLLFNYLSYPMKESESVVRSKKRAKDNTNSNGKTTKGTKKSPKRFTNLAADEHRIKKKRPSKSNGTNGTSVSKLLATNAEKKIRKKYVTKKMRAAIACQNNGSTKDSSSPRKTQRRGNNKTSPELRPRRRASQTYFFKYQLAKNPLKAEEEDLKLALLASLQQCGDSAKTPTLDSHLQSNPQQQQKTPANQPHQQTHKQPQSKSEPQNQKYLQNHKHLQNQKHIQNNKQPQKHQDLQQVLNRAPPTCDEEYLKKYRPETEDFLTFICFRITAPNFQNRTKTELTANGSEDVNSNHSTTNSTATNRKISDRQTFNDSYFLKRSSSPQKFGNIPAGNSSPNHLSPSNRRRPTRQSPRLASSNRKISEFDNSNHASTAYDNSMNYEEDMKRASIALEGMAQEISNADDVHNEIAQHPSDCNTKISTSPYKDNKLLVKGLMTREFAGAFADEEIIFESISNHKI